MDNASAANTRFGLNLMQAACSSEPSTNAFFSPLSISVALSMTQLGANGNTANEMAKALSWEAGKEMAIHEENQKYMSLLQKTDTEYTLSIANRLYVEQGYCLVPEFLQQTLKFYLAEAVAAQFKTNAEKERVDINTWVAQQTHDKIKDLIAQGVLNSLTRMVLVNAVYFKGNWNTQFKVSSTKPRPFKVSEGVSKEVPTMTAEKSFSFFMDDGQEGFSALELPYKGEDLSMVILLPSSNFGLASVEKTLTLEKLNAVFSKLGRPRKVQLSLPKFEATCQYSLNEPLQQLGMTLAFDEQNSDFSKMSVANDLFISKVVHKAYIKVDEAGSEAAASTAVVMMMRCAIPMEVPRFEVDHPFLFVIRDKRTSNSVILFMGRVVDPSQ